MVPTPMTGWSLLSSRSDWLLKSSRPVLPAWHWLIQRKSVLSAEQQTRSLSIILNSDLWYIYQPEKSLSAKTLVTKTKNFSTLLLLLMYSFMFIYNWGGNLPAMQETQVQSLGQEDPLEKGKATHSSILIWRIAWTEEPGMLQSMGPQTFTI